MAVPRPVLLAVLALALCAAAFLATRGAKDPQGAITAAPTPAPAAAPPAAKHHAPKPAKTHKAAPPAGATEAAAERAVSRGARAAQAATGTDRARKARAGAQPAKPQPKPAKPTAQQTAVEVTKALGAGDVVVFFFTHHGAADDQRTRQAVQALHGRKHVVVVEAGLEQLADYRPVLAGAGVSQVPSIVVVHADKPARLLEGYVDPGTLRQTVADALR
ncbi:MAG: hypothetical protein QOG63_862 [Thermoleophilaceae bacterium]|nr:hypothetical protein [Thermoleophilaceae bacterium]